jgi:hypothetical protein
VRAGSTQTNFWESARMILLRVENSIAWREQGDPAKCKRFCNAESGPWSKPRSFYLDPFRESTCAPAPLSKVPHPEYKTNRDGLSASTRGAQVRFLNGAMGTKTLPND